MFNMDFARMRGFRKSCSGDPMHPVRAPIVQCDGKIKLEVTGYEDTDEIIHSYASSCSLEAILARFANGDTSALNRYAGIYADVTDYPKNLAEAHQQLINAENAFNALPIDVKQKFGNDWRVWLSNADKPEWIEAMSSVLEIVKASPTPSDAASQNSSEVVSVNN